MYKVRGDSLAVLEYHYSDPFANTDGVGRINYYGITGYPTSVFNGTQRVVGGGGGTFNAYRNAFNAQIGVSTPGVLSLKIDNYNPSLRTGEIIVKLNSVEQIQESDLRLRCAITESHIFHEWSFLDSLHHVVRDMLPNHNGVSFSVNQGETLADTQSFYINPSWEDQHCYLAVFVQSDKEVTYVLISNLIPLFQKHVSGDANGDGVVTVSDVVFLTNYVLYGGVEPRPSASGDPNEDCVIDVADVVYLWDYVFLGGPMPLRGWEID